MSSSTSFPTMGYLLLNDITWKEIAWGEKLDSNEPDETGLLLEICKENDALHGCGLTVM